MARNDVNFGENARVEHQPMPMNDPIDAKLIPLLCELSLACC